VTVSTRDDSLPDNWVPVEQRWLGLDKRTIAPGLIAILLVIVFTVVVPAIDDSMEYDRQIEAGDVIDLGAGLTIVPPVGWGFPSGSLTSDDTIGGAEQVSHLEASLENSGLTVSITTGEFNGTPDQLLEQMVALNESYTNIDNSRALTESTTLTTASGLSGVIQAFAGVNIDGLLAAFMVDGIGIEIVVQGPRNSLLVNAETIAMMFDSLTYSDPEGAS